MADTMAKYMVLPTLVSVLELKSHKGGKAEKGGKAGKGGKGGSAISLLANMPKCHKMTKCLHFGSGSCIRILFQTLITLEPEVLQR